mmetsp:Transcript_10704/g.22992  ORF Transcript_10704/g.22992 Transcript_10704/m.22992 type:complete len:114 (-) Transcript_10704:404-745(-)|eukprot:CAMPEP_0183737400 /NCGR_PEP_ID=MMETSP0737-20130205/51847_1 /TAXON_ID=385413 /ORGANISM="Thalassiosira miniscula, Strain CCMP1093" /LENGTH=113 /DNA_ID=CAMNT_0025971667 /DNA_START=276 /DNA_END=617 /DNA_ORIENTATION=+
MIWSRQILTTKYNAASLHKHDSSIVTASSPYHRRRQQLSTKKPPASRPSSGLWKTLKAPALFGVGLYIGMMIFGEHQETKQGSEFFGELRGMFGGKGDGGGEGGHDNNEKGGG